MKGDSAGTGSMDTQASRRRFFRILAGSPLLAAAYPLFPPEWQLGVDTELRRAASARSRATTLTCADCGQVFQATAPPLMRSTQTSAPPPAQPPLALDVHLNGQLVDTAGEAINVWDFERVAHANTLPQHWAYIHMGVDDFETRYANREGYQKLGLRPRRLGPEPAKLDTAVTLFDKRWNTPLFLCPVAALEAYHTEGESGAARAAKARGILQIQSHQSSQSYEAIAEARGEPHWFQLYANADWDVNVRTLAKVSAAGCPVLVWTIDLIGGSNRELSRRSQGREGYDRPLCQSCHNHQEGYQRPMHRGVSGPPGAREIGRAHV